ncbi:hypothetical protein H310_07543 [Aphanomyces invadans]|uniref:Uncharacterized protein n=1 Tax=Aphanomyces invadans TaxID=157072 RepID=A0A024U1N8_9STRA|nr:hypothetical protein H310_07543 [Aphanomyces invadans]ETW00135.1 hypothetical protein H310_07543 [Aphanomyces invadans]|eukprot:XP_008871160.1 hypothetical protein H310_07543 [Aphanomyces invadans]
MFHDLGHGGTDHRRRLHHDRRTCVRLQIRVDEGARGQPLILRRRRHGSGIRTCQSARSVVVLLSSAEVLPVNTFQRGSTLERLGHECRIRRRLGRCRVELGRVSMWIMPRWVVVVSYVVVMEVPLLIHDRHVRRQNAVPCDAAHVVGRFG